ncbi:methyltransferase domain-containing protein, partial [Pirellulales bacterium]|nr:methyltransferase domain-containing protein [Pirellulales bacterium]
LLRQLAVADPNVKAAFGRHVHWGYWDYPPRKVSTVEEYGRAAEALCLRILECADIHDGQEILDVGCGFGGTLACLNERHSGVKLTGINIDQQQLCLAASQIKPRLENALELILADAARLPLADESIDVALAVESVFHFDRPSFFAEVSRVLRRGGSLTLSDFIPHERALPYIEAINLSGNEDVAATYGDIDVSWSVERYRSLAAACGLTLTAALDVTENTLPTYDFLRQSVESWTDQEAGQQFLRATGWLEKASRKGIITYQILHLEKC